MEPSVNDDGFKWFGEGFDGFPKRLPDDCIEYVIYIIDEKLNDSAAIKAKLNGLLQAANDLSKTLLKDYIWQRENFRLQIHPDQASKKSGSRNNQKSLLHLKGRTVFGDSLADEWLIVHLLLELSKQFPEAWIRTYDTDGEFLLIEAAKALPKWLNPDVAENRVWIHDGHLRVIPIDELSSKSHISMADALCFIQEQPEKIIVSPLIEDEAFYRLREYPSAIFSSLHHALVSIPRRLASVLHRNPAYISSAIEAFYLRDPISVKPLATKDISTLWIRPEDFVKVSVKFTKVGYAQLRGQVYDPPPAWTGVVPRMRDQAASMGMKLACGFEMMLSDPQNQDKRAVREVKLLLEDLDSEDEPLPSDVDIASWPRVRDDEEWLNIDYNDFEKELSGAKGKSEAGNGAGFGDARAQENLRKMVSRFEDFLGNDEAGIEGVDHDDAEDGEDESDSNPPVDEPPEAIDEEFKMAMEAVHSMGATNIEDSGLLAEARRLAIEDAEEQSDIDEDEEMKKVMELMEQELKDHGALKLNKDKRPSHETPTPRKPVFGPERPPHMQHTTMSNWSAENRENDAGPDNDELSSDEEDFNDIDLDLAKNMLESFKGQAGLAGPAGNLMGAMGITMPRDDGTSPDE